MIDNTIEAFNEWDNVIDYESDEDTVTLLDENKTPIAKFNYPRFTMKDFIRYKFS